MAPSRRSTVGARRRLRSELRLARLDLARRVLELGRGVAVVVGDAAGQVSGARAVDDAVGLEHGVDPLVAWPT